MSERNKPSISDPAENTVKRSDIVNHVMYPLSLFPPYI